MQVQLLRGAPMTLSDILTEWKKRYLLTDAEVEILATAVVENDDLLVIATSRRTTFTTVKKQSSLICRKTGSRNLAHAALRVFRERVLPPDEEPIEHTTYLRFAPCGLASLGLQPK